MPKFDESKDLLLEHLGHVKIGEDTKIEASVKSYDGGDPKLQLQRMFKDRFNNLGRLTVDEAQGLIPILQDFVDKYS